MGGHLKLPLYISTVNLRNYLFINWCNNCILKLMNNPFRLKAHDFIQSCNVHLQENVHYLQLNYFFAKSSIFNLRSSENRLNKN